MEIGVFSKKLATNLFRFKIATFNRLIKTGIVMFIQLGYAIYTTTAVLLTCSGFIFEGVGRVKRKKAKKKTIDTSNFFVKDLVILLLE